MEQRIRVLVVDDSAFLRKVVSQMLSRSPDIEVVGTARDGAEALELVEQLNPDVVTLDLVMPGLDGVGFLREQMARRPIPVVVCSIAHHSGELAMQAMDAGAVEFVQKPTALATEKVLEIEDDLVAKVRGAARARLRPYRPARGPDAPVPAPLRVPGMLSTDIIVIGVSTGGPQALRQLIPSFPADFPVPIVMVLHMPVGYTEMYAERLNEASSLRVTEAREGDVIRPGTALLAQAGRHLTFHRIDRQVTAHLDLAPVDTAHRPSVDVLFRSAADVYGERALGIVMTGMGEDGLLGAAHIKARGGRIITEAESSCVVYGMPRAVAEAGLSDRVVPLQDLASTVLEML
jgi:two-component system chemotaxis response regulator CheB